jgi:hypothetical protein
MLAALQQPNAIYVAGFYAWHKRVNQSNEVPKRQDHG